MKLKETIDNFKYLSEEKREESCSLFPKKGGSQFQVYKPNTASDNVMNYIFPDDNQNVREKNINTAKRVLSDKVRFSIPTINNDTDFGSTNGLVDVSDAMAIAIMYEYLNNKLKQNSILKNKTIENLIKDKINKFSDISNSIKEEKEEVKKTYDDFYNKIDTVGKIIESKNKPSPPPEKESLPKVKKIVKVKKQQTPSSVSSAQKTDAEKLDDIKSNFLTIMNEYSNKNIDEKKSLADETIENLIDLQASANAIDADDDVFQKQIDSLCNRIEKNIEEIRQETEDSGNKIDNAVKAAAAALQKNKLNDDKNNQTPKKKVIIRKKASSQKKNTSDADSTQQTGSPDFSKYGFVDED